jgi:glutamate formiminotransferase
MMGRVSVPADAPLLECVPNVSEGRDARVIDALAGAIRRVTTVKLANVHTDPDHHRSVFTILGSPPAVEFGLVSFRD